MHYRVAFLGFSEFERGALASYFRLAHSRTPRYEQVATLTDADFLVADADHGPSVQLVLATERNAETVFIGAHAPPGSTAWMMRPIDALHVMRELDAMVGLGSVAPHPDKASSARVTAPPAPVSATKPPRRARADVAPPAAPGPTLSPSPAAPASASPSAALPPSRSTAVMRPAAPALAPPTAAAPQPVSLLERAHAPQAQRPARSAPPPAASPPAAASPVVPAPAKPLPPATPRALLVDDSELALRFLASRLGRWRLDIDSASDSAQAQDLLARHSYDLVFLDIELGDNSELDGLALCQHIKHSATLMNATVILVSAHHSELDRVRGALAGCDAYLGKPLDEVELQRLLLRHGLKAPKDESAAQA